MMFSLTRPEIEPESTASVVDALFTRPLSGSTCAAETVHRLFRCALISLILSAEQIRAGKKSRQYNCLVANVQEQAKVRVVE